VSGAGEKNFAKATIQRRATSAIEGKSGVHSAWTPPFPLTIYDNSKLNQHPLVH
jgi:hypothetical protein